MSQPAWVGRYVGIPFRDDGLTRDGCHCWGLVRLVLAEQAGVEQPSYGENTAEDLLAAARHFRAGAGTDTWTAAPKPYRAFDGVLMTAMEKIDGVMRRLPAHCGIMISATHVLHVWKETNAVVMPLSHPRLFNKVLGVFRHKDLA